MKKDSFKSIQDAWIRLILDFRSWYYPENQFMKEWKNREILKAIRACPSRMVDDAESMLSEYRKSQVTGVTGGASAFMPILLTATALIDQPPSSTQLIGVPYSVPIEIEGKYARMRMKPTAVRAQIAFFATNPNDARSVCEQFCMYMTDDDKRKIKIKFDLGAGISRDFGFMVLENELFPSPVPSEAINLSVVVVDVTLIGYVPQVIGLDDNNDIDNGIDEEGKPLEKPLIDAVVTQADSYSNDGHQRVTANRETGETFVEKNIEDQP